MLRDAAQPSVHSPAIEFQALNGLRHHRLLSPVRASRAMTASILPASSDMMLASASISI
jgi:hypothetical protein